MRRNGMRLIEVLQRDTKISDDQLDEVLIILDEYLTLKLELDSYVDLIPLNRNVFTRLVSIVYNRDGDRIIIPLEDEKLISVRKFLDQEGIVATDAILRSIYLLRHYKHIFN